MQVVKFEMDVSTTQIPRGKGNSWSLFLVLCSMMCRTLSPSIIHLFEYWDTYKWTHEKGKNYTRSSLTILSLNIKNCVAACNETSTPTDTLSVIKYHLMTPQQALWQTPKPSLQSQYYHPLKVIDSQSDLQQSAYEVARAIWFTVGNQTSLCDNRFHARTPQKQIALFSVVAYPDSYYCVL